MKLIKRKFAKPSARQPRLMEGQETNNFRRSRTLTGSKSSDVRAANEKRGTLQSDRLKKQTLRRHQRLLFVGLGILFVMISGLYYLLSQYVGSVHVVYSSTPALITQPPTKPYADAILEYLGTRPGERFRFSLSSSALTKAVSQKYPEVGLIKTAGGKIGQGNFTVIFREPTVSWKIGQKNYFIDGSGEAFDKNFYKQPPVSVIDNSGASLSEDSALVSKGFLRFVGRLVALTNQSGLGTVTEVILPPNTTREVDIKLQGRGYTIKTHIERDPAAEVEDMQRVIAYLEQKKITPSYIDLRVAGRAYYK